MTDLLPPREVRPVRRRPRSAAPVEDARIAARRRRVEEEERRRRHRFLAVPIGALALVAVVGGVLFSPLTALDGVAVAGTSSVPEDRVIEAAALEAGTPLIRVDEREVAGRVEELPWVASVDVDRRWPRGVLVTVTERTPLVRLAAGPAEFAVDRFGRVLGAAPASLDLMPLEVAGLAAPEPGALLEGHAGAAVGVVEQFNERLRSAVAAVSVDRRGELFLDLADGGRVRFGRAMDVPAKLLAVESFVGGGVDLTDLAVLDVREPSHVVITRAGTAGAEEDEVDDTTTTGEDR